jgi:catechol 2,3-dioxygenase-like lactoylglutathione lyase family enzyme
MATITRVAPILPIRDVEVSLAFYARLGFTTRAYEGGGYGFATWDDLEIHLGTTTISPFPKASLYAFVDDADALAARWAATGAEVHPPEDTPWGQHEGALVDPDGNVIRFGSPPKTDG